MNVVDISDAGRSVTAGKRLFNLLDIIDHCWLGKRIEHYECYDDDDDDESLSVWDAADIWASNGKDEDYTFGYSEDELEEALNS